MVDKSYILNLLNNYKTNYPEEQPFIQQAIDFASSKDDCFERSCLTGHFTGSCWILNADKSKVLLTHHKKLNRWLQLGGHVDGNPLVYQGALREAEEESGISGIKLLSDDIFDIDIHPIPNNLKKGEPEHLHYDIRYLLQAPNEDFTISNESNDLTWLTLDEIEAKIKSGEVYGSLIRMTEKWRNLK